MKLSWTLGIALALAGGVIGTPQRAQGKETRMQDAPLTPWVLKMALEDNPVGADAEKLAARIRAWFGKEALAKGTATKVDGRAVAWAIEAPGKPAIHLLRDDESVLPRLQRIGDTDVYAMVDVLLEGDGMVWHYDVDGKSVGGGNLEIYTPAPETLPDPNVPKGTVTKPPIWKSKVFEGTERDWWVYVPAQYKPENPACVMVFQDGGGPQNYIPTVFDNLIAKGDMPVTVGIFINPGHFPDGNRSNRSFEYDTLSDQYSRFLLEEILPEVEKTVKLRHDPASRAIAGISSGGICAFTVAWERPDQFSKVLSWVGSFTGIASGKTLKEGGNNYPVMIRKTDPPKPIRVFLQDGSNDLDNEHGSWPLANQEMARALAFRKYDYKFVFGKGFHSDRHGRAILPNSLRWLWRNYKP